MTLHTVTQGSLDVHSKRIPLHILLKSVHQNVHSGSPLGRGPLSKPVVRDLGSTVDVTLHRLLGMRHIDSKAMGKNVVLVAEQSQVDDPLHLVLPVIHETLVESRELRGALDEDIRLLDVILHAAQGSHVGGFGQRVPLVKVVGLGMSKGR